MSPWVLIVTSLYNWLWHCEVLTSFILECHSDHKTHIPVISCNQGGSGISNFFDLGGGGGGVSYNNSAINRIISNYVYLTTMRWYNMLYTHLHVIKACTNTF